MSLTFGVLLLQDRALADITSISRDLDAAGVDSLWVADHTVHPHSNDGPWLDPWVTMAAVAQATSRCSIGPLVATFVSNPPLALARRTHSMQVLSNQRFVLGLGAGGVSVDRAVYRIPDTTGRELLSRLDAGITELLSCLSGERIPVPLMTSIAGRPTPTEITVNFVEPVVVPPLLIGGQSAASVALAARYAQVWNMYRARGAMTFTDSAKRCFDLLNEQSQAQSREAGSVRRSVLLDLTNETSAPNRAALVDVVGRLHDLGFDECIAYAWGRDVHTRTTDDLLAFMSDDLPALRAG